MSARHARVPLMIRIRHWISGARPAIPKPSAPPTWSPPGPHRTLLFVDFDGVLHRAENGSFEFLPNLLRILRLRPDVDVVISSSWRVNATREWLLDHFPPSSHDRIVGVTPVRAGPYQRQAECLAFAHAVGATRFLAIDDDRELFHPECPWVVYTDRYEGLNVAMEVHLLQRLSHLTGVTA